MEVIVWGRELALLLVEKKGKKDSLEDEQFRFNLGTQFINISFHQIL